MQKFKKKEIIKIIEAFIRANDLIERNGYKNTGKNIIEALTNCQETAIILGNYLETLGNSYESFVHVLEEYCENIYQLSLAIRTVNDCSKISKKILKQLVGLKNSIYDEFPNDKKEVVFFPYKASMWDSLESVYLEALKDNQNDVYCVPIPYYDLLPDRSVGEMHYEGNEYPSNIEIFPWQNYNLAERKPDKVYIHNPYDSWNHVTSVLPDFYASNIRKHAEMLIYIPYFILPELKINDYINIQRIKQFFFLPGIIYADKVILQSENIRQIYIIEYLKAAKENGLSGNYIDKKCLEEKFLGTGSPKIDKLVNMSKDEVKIPDEWLKTIYKKDGSRKKIVFYNTGISALLAHNERWILKLEDALAFFKDQKDNIALLWRPHPLIESTLKSMRTELLDQYLALKATYISEGWGIYDNSPDIDRAILLSDVYYGDQSSVVLMFNKMKKMTMIQDTELCYKKK